MTHPLGMTHPLECITFLLEGIKALINKPKKVIFSKEKRKNPLCIADNNCRPLKWSPSPPKVPFSPLL